MRRSGTAPGGRGKAARITPPFDGSTGRNDEDRGRLSATDQAAREEQARDFLGALFGSKPPNTFIQIWSKSAKSSSYVQDVPTAAQRAVAVARDAYVGVSLVGKDLGKKRRGGNADAMGIPGFWADIDVNGGPTKQEGKAPSFDAAYELATSVVPPTLIVNSGYGLQGWWLFEEPWVFGSAAERDRAAQLCAGWIARLRKEAKARDFTIDATQDLARLMRVPGTINAKGGKAAPVTLTDHNGARFAIEALAEHVEAVAVPQELGARVEVVPTGNLPFEKLQAMIDNNERFADTWKRERKDMKDSSPSGYCLSIASFCAHADWTDQEIANVLAYYREKHKDEPKYEDWYGRTIRKARSTIRESKRENERDAAVEKLVEIGESDEEEDADADEIAALFSKIIGGGFKVKELIQSNADPDTAIYRLIMDDGSIVPIGSFDNLDDPNKFAKRFAVVKKFRPPLVKKGDWIKALNGLLKMAVVRDAEVTTLRSQVLTALRSYIDATLTPDHNEAAARRDPFEKNGFVWIAPKSFHDYMTRQLRKRLTFGDLEEALDILGFEKRAKNFKDSSTASGQNTTRDYYRAPLSVLDESIAHEEEADHADA